jgi:nitrite reductase (NADH) small subunit
MAMDDGLVRICGVGELPPEGGLREFKAGAQLLCVAVLNGKVRALDNACPHHGGPLGEGVLENGKVICPWHAYAFDLETGISADDPEERVRVFEVTVAGEDVLVQL